MEAIVYLLLLLLLLLLFTNKKNTAQASLFVTDKKSECSCKKNEHLYSSYSNGNIVISNADLWLVRVFSEVNCRPVRRGHTR